MSGVTSTRARVDKLLVNVSRRQNVDELGLVADKVLTFIQVSKSTGLIGNYDKSNLRVEHDLVGGDVPYPRITASVKSSDRYIIEKHGLSGMVNEDDLANEEQPFDARKDKTMDLTDKIALGKEVALATPLTSTTTMTYNVTLSGTDQYNDYTNSTPIEDFKAARASIYTYSGKIVEAPGGFAIVPYLVYNTLKFHPDLIENIKYTVNMKSGLSFQQLADTMGVSRILVPFARYNSAAEGATDVLSPVWGKHIVFGFAPPVGRKGIETLGFRIQQRNGNRRVFVNKIGNPPNSEEILVDDAYDFLLTEVGAGYLIYNAIA